ncbi:MAG: LacI family DNA-binding transcriptional regulator [Candidatus Limiplasma sp.]|nr:LacI family DNA-binding transcriptional regulator [Candidatus Limiplasma sp.]
MKGDMTIYGIAKECGVSVSTVSRVLNNNPRVSEKTRAAVMRVIEAHHFSPSGIARAMTNQTTRSIGIMLPDITNPYFSALFLEIQRYTLEHGYSALLFNTLFGGSSHKIGSPFEEMQYFEMLKDKRVDGCIILGGQMDLDHPSEAYVQALNRLNASIPVVAIGQPLEGCDCIFINRDLGGGVAALLQHLAALGNRHIGFIGGQQGVRQTTERLKAYRAALEALGLPLSQRLVRLSNYYLEDGYAGMKALLDDGEKIDAMVAVNDQVAVGAIRAMRDAGLCVPEDISVASCDSFPGGEYQCPRLTGLNQQNEYIGKLAILSLMSAMSGVRETIHIHHSPVLVIRESCGSHLGIRSKSQ